MVNTSCANRVSSSSCPGRLTKLSRQFHREMSDQAIGICETSHATQVVQLIRGWIDSGIGTRATGVCVCLCECVSLLSLGMKMKGMKMCSSCLLIRAECALPR